MEHKLQRGFSLIELMIVVAIIGILASLSIYIFHEFTVRARVTEGLVQAPDLKNLVLENAATGMADATGGLFKGMQTGGGATCSAAGVCSLNGGGGLTSNVASIEGVTANGSIIITFAPNASGRSLELWPSAEGAALSAGTVPNNIVVWTCFSAGKAQYAGSNHAATMPARYAPPECR